MNQADFTREMEANARFWDSIKGDVRRDHKGEFVGITEGRLIATSPNYDEVSEGIRRASPNAECYFIFPVDEEPILDFISDYGRQA